MMKLTLGIAALFCLGSLCSAKSLTSYEGFKVLRVKVSDREAADRLHQLGDDFSEFWSDLPGRHADLMIAPEHFESMSGSLATNGFEFSTLVENVAGASL